MLTNLALQFTNRLSGTYFLDADPPQPKPLHLEISGKVPSLVEMLFGPRVKVAGTISLPGLTENRQVAGDIEVLPLRRVRLDLCFTDEQGVGYRVETAKDFQLGDALQGRTSLEGVLCRASGEPLGHVRIDVDLIESFGQMWGSLRPSS